MLHAMVDLHAMVVCSIKKRKKSENPNDDDFFVVLELQMVVCDE
jgi:hypothetical protein